ncbi:hypothetical protein J6590_102042 [Homalodisca vitripennis]|nr:hypothetical protein J6590_102042 [Homalodisca vitripennis]
MKTWLVSQHFDDVELRQETRYSQRLGPTKDWNLLEVGSLQSLASARDQLFPEAGSTEWQGPPMGWELKEAKVFRGLEHIETTTCQRRDLPVAGALKRPKHPEGWDLSESGNTQRQGPTQTGNCQGPVNPHSL